MKGRIFFLPFISDAVNSDHPKGGETSLPFLFVAMRGCCALMFAISRRYQNPISNQPASKEQFKKAKSNIGSSLLGIKELKVKVTMKCMILQKYKSHVETC